MGAGRALLVGRAIADDGTAGDEAGAIGFLRGRDGIGDRLFVMTVDADSVPACSLEAGDHVARLAQAQIAVDGDVIVVEQDNQLRQFQMAGEADRLMADAFHQVAVRGDDIGMMIDNVIAEARGEVALGHCHADGRRNALAERSGGGLDARRFAEFRMARRPGAELAEILELLEGHFVIAEQIEQAIEQHRSVTGRQDEAVAVRPVRILGIEFQEFREQNGCNVRGSHRHARMAGLGFLDGVHRQGADGIGHHLVLRAGGRHGGLVTGCACRFVSWRHSVNSAAAQWGGGWHGGSLRPNGLLIFGGRPEALIQPVPLPGAPAPIAASIGREAAASVLSICRTPPKRAPQ